MHDPFALSFEAGDTRFAPWIDDHGPDKDNVEILKSLRAGVGVKS